MRLFSRSTDTASAETTIFSFFSRLAFGVAVFLMIPLTAMQFSEDVNWSLFDFILAWTILVGSGMTYKLVARTFNSSSFRLGVGLAVGTSLVLVWINLAVGFIGSEDHPANLMYFMIILLGFTGAILSQFRPKGLSLTMFGMAAGQFLVPVIAYVIWRPELTIGVLKIFLVNFFFVLLYIASAMQFRKVWKSLPLK